MKTCDKPLDFGQKPNSRSSQSSGSITTTPELSLCQKFRLVVVAALSSFAVGSIPVVYAFTGTPAHNQATTQTPIPRGEMF